MVSIHELKPHTYKQKNFTKEIRLRATCLERCVEFTIKFFLAFAAHIKKSTGNSGHGLLNSVPITVLG